MKRTNIILFLALFSFSIHPCCGQEEIQYGSNNGQHILIHDTKIYYEEYGAGTPLFLIHGGGGSMRHYAKAIPGLSKHFKIIAVDSPGHGRSEQPDTLSYQLIADYISEIIDKMALDSVYVMGCSDGGIVGLILAHDRPDKVKKFVCDGALTDKEDYKPGTLERLESVSPETRSESWVKNYKSLSPQPDRWKEFVIQFKKMWLTFPYVPDSTLRRIKVPTLIMLGDRDSFIPIEVGLKMHRAIAGSEFCVVPGAGHCVVTTDPNLMNDIVIPYLKLH